VTVNFYYRNGCHLCEDLYAELLPYETSHGLTIIMHNIDKEPALKEKYNQLIPVLTDAGGNEICHYFFDKAGFEKLLTDPS